MLPEPIWSSGCNIGMQVVARLDDVDMRLRSLDTKVAASDACIQDIASRMAAMTSAGQH